VTEDRPSGGRKLLAWLVHGYTALGLVIAGVMAVLIIQGTEPAFRLAFLLMGVAMIVDATDGWMARKVGVARVLPEFDGRRLDDIIDFHTYASLPLLLLWQAGVLEGAAAWLLVVPLLASGYGFSQVHAKTDDGHFLGFPSYWNVVAFYLFFLEPPPGATAALLLLFSALTVVPSRYLAPSRPGPLSLVTNFLGAAWGLLVILFLVGVVEGTGWVLATLFFPAWYLGASWAMGRWAGRRE
jgi:phosphatidylcholine synthase